MPTRAHQSPGPAAARENRTPLLPAGAPPGRHKERHPPEESLAARSSSHAETIPPADETQLARRSPRAPPHPASRVLASPMAKIQRLLRARQERRRKLPRSPTEIRFEVWKKSDKEQPATPEPPREPRWISKRSR